MAGPVSVYSDLLTREENELLFSMLGARVQCKATAVVQMFHAHPNPAYWTMFRTGVICFVKDYHRRTYQIQLFDVLAGDLLFEQELYKQFVYCRDCSYFHSFPGDSFMVGLNFADEAEATSFCLAVSRKLKPGNKKAKRPVVDVHVPVPQQHRARSQTIVTGPPSMGGDRRKSRRIKTRGPVQNAPRKEAHQLAMIGFDPETGVFNSHRIHPKWLQLLDSVGVTLEQLKDIRTALFITEFVDKHGGIEEANRQLVGAARTPPHSPVRSRAKSVMVRRGKSYRGRGQRPPTQHSPPPVGIPAPPPLHLSAHLHVPAAPPPPAVGVSIPPPPPIPSIISEGSVPVAVVKGGLLADIEAGYRLRPVDTSKREGREKTLTGMAAALANALNMRNRVMQFSDEEDDDQEAVDNDDWNSD